MKTILLHGLGQTSSSWKNTINTMGKSADILCPNLFDWFEDKEVCYQVLYLAFPKSSGASMFTSCPEFLITNNSACGNCD